VTRVVPTILPGLNRAIVCGGEGQPPGYPLGTTGIIHGPAAGGKTALVLALAISFQRAGGYAGFVDAENTLHVPWAYNEPGGDPHRFLYLGRYPWEERDKEARKKEILPLYFEDAILEVDRWISGHVAGVKAGKKPGPFLIAVDSLRKLTPKAFTKKLMKAKGDVRSTALGREQAAFNTGWCAELGPKICDHDIAVIFIQHEGEGEIDKWGRATVKLRGGAGITYDASMRFRMEFATATYDKAKDKDAQTPNVSVGKKHRGVVEKNKIGPQHFGIASTFEYFVSSGDGRCPVGWDRPRELLNEALRRGVVKGAEKWGYKTALTLGSRFGLGNKRYTLKQLYERPELLAKLEEVLR
jgi:RecA/RadA recombinase